MSLDREENEPTVQYSLDGYDISTQPVHVADDCDMARLWDNDTCIAEFTKGEGGTFTLTSSDVAIVRYANIADAAYPSATFALEAAREWYAHRS